ncbi:sentrin-specific protease 7 isoform X1 [Thamnophis elegans]|uniref:sentrin-specific protease 7 isoform X1 n=1 Tax=Thamnophis elegans TaxID=35005 RepID=UPI0013773391|nr:sentrin-specific protease 7 isoform X1 [Thamnophis elegans]XP_032075648.1 sentrin-specific protease 7 isoform X1 [Thamnophis elegans]
MEGSGKSSSYPQNYRIPKKGSNTKPDDEHIQSPLSRFEVIHPLQNSFQGWASGSRNKRIQSNWKSKSIGDERPLLGQPKVILTNVLKTELGRKYIKTQFVTGANLSHAIKLQSNQQTSSSVDTLEIWHILNPLHQSLFLSESRQPKVILRNILRTKTGREYMQKQHLTDAKLSDANKLQSDEQPSLSISSLKSCQTISSQQSCIFPKRYENYPKRSHEKTQYKDTELSNALQTLRKCDVLLEDCSINNKRGHKTEKRQEDFKNVSPSLMKSSCQNNESRKRRGVFCSHWNEASPKKSLLKEHKTESVQSPGDRDSSENHQNLTPSLQEENIQQPLESDFNETLNTTDLGTTGCCPSKNNSNSSPDRKLYSSTNEDKSILSVVSSSVKEEVNTTSPLKNPLNKSEMNKETAESSEPIILSSDEEELSELQDPEIYFQTEKDHEVEKTDKEQENVLHLSEDPSQYETKSKAKEVSADPLVLHSSADHSTINEHVPLALDIKFERMYFGKHKRAAAGYARFTINCITIPFEVALNKKIVLSIDSLHLKRFGLWTNKDSSNFGNSAIIFLWLSLDYMEQVENQLGRIILNKQVKGSKFVFIQLSQMLTEKEQVMLNRIIAEISTKIHSADLTNFLPWQQAIDEISCEENSFMHYCYETFQKHLERNRTSVSSEQPLDECKSNLTKPNYTLLQKEHSGQYSFSISSGKGKEWKELQETRPMKNLIVYPPSPAKGGLGVTKEDLECLEYGEFLNDVIIDFYLKYLQLEKAPKELADRSHIFSSFFYKCLTRTEKNSEENPKLSIAQRRHRRVKRWTRYINIFNKDYIFVPVNEESHWYIAVICFPWLENVIYKDCENQHWPQSDFQQFPHQSESNSVTIRKESVLVLSDIWCDTEEQDIKSNLHHEDIQPGTIASEFSSKVSKKFSDTLKIKKICKRPCILILDSLKASSVQNTVQILREYLEAEWEAKRKTCREFSKSTMVDFCPRVPKQNNNSDCGIYLLQYVETFFQNPIVNFELPVHLEQWFPPHLVRRKREQIRDLILQLHFQQQGGSKS